MSWQHAICRFILFFSVEAFSLIILFLTLSHDVSKALVRFDFEVCDYTNLITTSIEALTFTDELNTIVDMTLNPVIARAPFLPSSFTDNVKASIVSEAEAKVNEVKTEVISQLNSLLGNCAQRRLSQMKLNEDGSQRMLQGGLNFGDLATSIEVIDGVVSVCAQDAIISL